MNLGSDTIAPNAILTVEPKILTLLREHSKLLWWYKYLAYKLNTYTTTKAHVYPLLHSLVKFMPNARLFVILIDLH